MRQIIVDSARRRTAAKRGGREPKETLDDNAGAVAASLEDLVALEEALKKLEALDERLARLVELRFFGGLSVEESAEILETSTRTVKRDWQEAGAFVSSQL